MIWRPDRDTPQTRMEALAEAQERAGRARLHRDTINAAVRAAKEEFPSPLRNANQAHTMEGTLERLARVCDEPARLECLFKECDEAMERMPDAPPTQPVSDLYYVQDSRSYCGNDVLWWGENDCGYTTDLGKAQVYTLDQIKSFDRESDVAWPKAYIDQLTRPAVDMQRLDKKQAITLEKRKEIHAGD